MNNETMTNVTLHGSALYNATNMNILLGMNRDEYLLAMLAENDLWAPRITRAQKAALGKLPREAIASFSRLCHEEMNRAEGRAALAKLGQRVRESPALEQNRDAYAQATTKDSPRITSTCTSALTHYRL